MKCPTCRNLDNINTEMTGHRTLKNELIYVCPLTDWHTEVKRDPRYLKQLEDRERRK